MKRLVFIPLCFILLACGCLDRKEPAPVSTPTSTAADIIEENKEELTYIKDRTADDLELGHLVRKMVIDGKLSNSAIGFHARELVLNQKTTPDKIKSDNG